MCLSPLLSEEELLEQLQILPDLHRVEVSSPSGRMDRHTFVGCLDVSSLSLSQT